MERPFVEKHKRRMARFVDYLRVPPSAVKTDSTSFTPTTRPGLQMTLAIGLWQPFASLVAFGLKTIETRLRPTNIRGRIIICATKKVAPNDLYQRTLHRIANRGNDYNAFYPSNLPVGVMLCSCNLIDCRQMVDADEGLALIGKTDDSGRPRWAWILENIIQLPRVPVKCGQGWFYIDETKLV
jgi:hypothetical protein